MVEQNNFLDGLSIESSPKLSEFYIHDDVQSDKDKYKRKLKNLDEEHKQKVMHLETVGMMTKYQLVFVKVEAQLMKLALLYKTRTFGSKLSAFQKIKLKSWKSNILLNGLTLKVFKNFENNMTCLVRILTKLRIIKMRKAFIHMKVLYKNSLHHKELTKTLQIMKEEFVANIKNKEKNLLALKKIMRENEEIFKNIQSKEIAEDESKIKSLELKKKINIDQKLKNLERENQELRFKIEKTEKNIVLFVKEMSDMLEMHELSTNIDLDDLNLSNYSEILENHIKESKTLSSSDNFYSLFPDKMKVKR